MSDASGEDAPILPGSCLCGAVRFEVHGSPEELLHCHCRMCQRAHGAAYATFVLVHHADFHVTAGAERIATYRSSADARRTFCDTCGSALQFIRDERPTIGLAVSVLDGRLPELPERGWIIAGPAHPAHPESYVRAVGALAGSVRLRGRDLPRLRIRSRGPRARSVAAPARSSARPAR